MNGTKARHGGAQGATAASDTTATGAEAATTVTRHEAEVAITLVENTDDRKTVRVVAAFAYTISKGADGRWASDGIEIGGKVLAEMGGNNDWKNTLAFGLRNAGLALGNRAVKVIEPPVRGERAANPTALRQTATAQVDGLINAGLVKSADRDAAIEGAVTAALAERETKRAAKRANGGPAPAPAGVTAEPAAVGTAA